MTTIETESVVDDKPEPTTSSYLEFPKPESLELPQGTQDKSEVDMLATFRVKGDKLCLVAVEGIPLVEEAPEVDPEESFTGAVEHGL